MLRCLLIFCCAVASSGADWYASPSGSAGGAGTIGDPITLAKALGATSPAAPGDTIWLRGGTYSGAFTSVIAGSSGNPVLVRQYPGERAKLDGNGFGANTLSANGDWVTYQDFEVMNSDPDRVTSRWTGVSVAGGNLKFINMIVHDTGNGFFCSEGAASTEIYGCVIYHHGYQGTAPDRGHGHGIYAQNSTGTKTIKSNIVFNQFGWGVHIYGESAQIKGFDIRNNVAFNNGVIQSPTDYNPNYYIASTSQSSDAITFHQNRGYFSQTRTNYNMQFGTTANNGSVNVASNYMGRGIILLWHWTNSTVTANSFQLSERVSMNPRDSVLGPAAPAYTWDNNSYSAAANNIFDFIGGSQQTFVAWKSNTGLDANSTFTTSAPTGATVFIDANTYESGRANIAVYNWDLADNVSVDLSSVLVTNALYRIRDTQNLLGPFAMYGQYGGGSLSLPMTNLVAATPAGFANPPAHSGPEFVVFLVETLPGNRAIKPRRNGGNRLGGL